MANRGNTGHRGYKMSTVTAVRAQDNTVIVSLECDHTQTWTPWSHGETAEEWVAEILAGTSNVTIGQSKIRCSKQHWTQR